MVAGFSAVNAALRFQIDNCLRHAERFMENPRAVIMDARRHGDSPAGMIGAVASRVSPRAGRAARHRRGGDRGHRGSRHSREGMALSRRGRYRLDA
jgi:hypothetical protein